jgi:hypothetical protein
MPTGTPKLVFLYSMTSGFLEFREGSGGSILTILVLKNT